MYKKRLFAQVTPTEKRKHLQQEEDNINWMKFFICFKVMVVLDDTEVLKGWRIAMNSTLQQVFIINQSFRYFWKKIDQMKLWLADNCYLKRSLDLQLGIWQFAVMR